MHAPIEVNNRLRVKLCDATKLQFDEAICKQNFVPIRGGSSDDIKDGKCRNLQEKIFEDFIGNAACDVLLLLGSAGTGKSWFGQALVLELWKNSVNDDTKPVPLWIELPAIEKPHENIIRKHLIVLKELQKECKTPSHMRLTIDDIEIFLELKPELFVVLDAYDELPQSKRVHNFYKENHFHDKWPSRVHMLVASRSEVLSSGYERRFASAHNEMLQYYVQPYTIAQKDEVIAKFVKSGNAHEQWTVKKYQEKLKLLPDDEILRHPFLLHMVLEVLPDIIAELDLDKKTELDATKQQLLQHQLLRCTLYQRFLRRYYAREADKFKEKKRIQLIEEHLDKLPIEQQIVDDPLPYILETYTRTLARTMFQHRSNNYIVWYPERSNKVEKTFDGQGDLDREACEGLQNNKSIVKNKKWLRPYFDTNVTPYANDLRRGSPVIKSGKYHYKFLHQSLYEFYACKHLFEGALQHAWRLSGSNLNRENLQTEPNLLHILARLAHDETLFEKILFEIIETSKSERSIWRAAANAMTILNCANVGLQNRDFRHIRIGGEEEPGKSETGWGADLSHAILFQTDFSEADLRYVRFYKAQLYRANLTGACLDGIDFGERPSLQAKWFAFSGNGKWLVTVKRKNVFSKYFEITILSWPELSIKNQWKVSFMRDRTITCIAVSHDGSNVALGIGYTRFFDRLERNISEKDIGIQLWDTATESLNQSICGHSRSILSLCFSPSGEQLVSSSYSKYEGIKLWNLLSGECKQIEIISMPFITSLHYSPKSDSGKLALCTAAGSVVYLNGQRFGPLQIQTTLISNEDQRSYRLIRTDRMYQIHELLNPATDCKFSPDGKLLATLTRSYYDSRVAIWNVSLKRPELLYSHKVEARQFSCSFTKNELAIASGGQIKLLELDRGKIKRVINCNRSIERLSYSPSDKELLVFTITKPDYNELLVLTNSNKLQFFDVAKKEVRRLFTFDQLHARDVNSRASIYYSKKGDKVLFCHGKFYWIWNSDSGKFEKFSDTFHDVSLEYILYSGSRKVVIDNNIIVKVNASSSIIYLKDALTKKIRGVLRGHRRSVCCLNYSPIEKILASGSDDNTLRLWSMETRRCLAVIRIPGLKEGVSDIIWHPEGYQLAIRGRDMVLRVYRLYDDYRILKPCLLWQSHSNTLMVEGLCLEQCTGLSQINYRLLQQYTNKWEKIIGTPADPKYSTTEKTLKSRNKQVHIKSKSITPLLDDGNGSYLIDQEQWLISLVRDKIKKENFSNHVYLILQGLDKRNYTVVKKIHLVLDTDEAQLFESLGKATICVTELNPYNLQKLNENCQAKCWMITQEDKEILLKSVSDDRKRGPKYLKIGRSPSLFDMPFYNCASWCEKKLKDIGIEAMPNAGWSDCFIAVPERLFNDATIEKHDRKCHLM